MRKIALEHHGEEMSFEEALKMATEETARLKGLSSSGVAIVAWYDRRSGRSSPEVGFYEDRVVNWLGNAIRKGADVWIESDRFIFLCGSSLKH